MTFELRNVSTNCAVGLGTVINGERSLMPGKKVDVITMEDMEKARKIVANFRHLLTLTAVIEPVVETSSVEAEETVAPSAIPTVTRPASPEPGTASTAARGAHPLVSTAVRRPSFLASRKMSAAKRGCISGSPPDSVTPPPEGP